MGEQKVKTIDLTLENKTETPTSKKKGKKGKKQVARVRIYIKSTYNNTIITVTDLNGNVLIWGTAGKTGFKGSRKSTPYAAQRTMEELLREMKNLSVQEADIVIKGVGIGRESAVRALIGTGIEVMTIRDKTPVPHGGVRKKKPRRV